MDRRNFIKTAVLGAIAVPIVGAQEPREKNWITVLDSVELRRNGVRGEFYSANVIDLAGNFWHEPKYNGMPYEYFVIKCYVSKVLPRIWSEDHNKVYDFLENDFDAYNFRQELIDECKKSFAYTAIVQYVIGHCMCGEENCKTHFTPMIRGLSKSRYNKYFEPWYPQSVFNADGVKVLS